ncbi:receptor-like protein 2, partial [Phalaenopsis equestris]|uniref:receptor-like protein 2 n=1 Tax=Phalaenopsis equestris TaxID=78828 RepID=UPI0009E1D90D
QNYLTGNIPSWIGDRLLSLKILRLRSNKFYGSIPSQLSKLKGLQILDIADNFLSGPIPKSFKLLNSMTIQNKRLQPLIPSDNVFFQKRVQGSHVIISSDSNIYWSDALMINIKGIDREFTDILSLVNIIDLSCNNLTGDVPIELMSLVGLISLNLSRNELKGRIPINICDMQSLESLDLSKNHFSGEIPESIAKLSKLNYLNLSYNQLSGRIPRGTQLDTFKELSYYGNSELCGMPLSKTCEDDDPNSHTRENNFNDDDAEDDNFGLFLSIGLGFAVGLWGVLGTLLLKMSWAITYFQWYDNLTNNIYVYVVVRINRWFNN